MGLRFRDLGFRGLRFRGLGFGGLRFRGLGFRGLGFRGLGFRGLGWFRVKLLVLSTNQGTPTCMQMSYVGHPPKERPQEATLQRINLGYCPHPVTVHVRGQIKGYV